MIRLLETWIPIPRPDEEPGVDFARIIPAPLWRELARQRAVGYDIRWGLTFGPCRNGERTEPRVVFDPPSVLARKS